ncbi:phage integrase Arm DNA-binding domain-containing protein [Enterobacter hormaechei]|uniref:phage integrase Arm DNA-binding domain-containing protein n=1 Tax=Enterobacter hormaechei TaxID=158836 RepID=UPI0005EEB6BD|nr:phage integrase Arm DNA-binding domain-containing protein [Enterobacter hormaechei]KJL55766.1 integrase [Enterobacter hormaechei subsp. steigerwaltii]OXU39414.1 integrase [Enterobacter hormaechei subsp. steigerwaltii]HDV8236518.1 phage integrase Arm DNA-binding domain-containing protein [Enterobacter hormaechei]HDV8256609.1 phage integrase Arm DNA-binding domain-containing protein [Enterobacter hormaechei]HDV8266105.1 phage integrase Arm DNA-binding domain-containing protein [Enterobacter h
MSPRPRKNSISIPGLYARFDRRTDKTYYQYKNPVTGKFHGLGTDKAKAEKIAATANQRIAAAETDYFLKQIDEKPAANKTRGISLKGWVVRYEKVQRTRVSNGELSEGRFKEKMRMANLLAERLGNHPLRSLEVRDFSLLLEEWLDKGQASTALNNRVVWIDLYREAQHAGEVPPGWNPPEATRKPIPKVSRARLSIEDWKAIFSVAPEGHYIRNAMLLALVAGQRREDIVRMKFSDVWDDHLHVIQGKTGMRLALPLSLYSEAVGITLREVIAGCRDRIVSPYLIHSQLQKKGQPMSKDNLSDYFAEARDKAGIKPPEGKTPTTFHEQRSLSERLYRAQGIDTKTLLGHKVQATTDKYNDTRGQEWIKLVI